MNIDGFKICYYPVLKVKYESNNAPQDLSDILKMDPIVLIMSKNAVIGLEKWLAHFSLEANFFSQADFWTVGERTNAYLNNILGIQSFYPDEMTGKGIIKKLNQQNHSRVLLISGQDPRYDFIEGLSLSGINYFHFPVYKICFEENSELPAHFKNSK